MATPPMFDARLRRWADPALHVTARAMVRAGISANVLTGLGLLVGLGAAALIVQQHYVAALLLIALNRGLDGLDGAVARATQPSDVGGYFDSLADYIFYVAVPVAFALAAPANALPALLLVASFVLTAVSFLALAAIAGRRGITTDAHGPKSFFYSTGLVEGGETILAFAAMCLWPQHFALIAYGFALLCLATVVQRGVLAVRLLR
jgi:phosphatidylglycerophosphate synthase